MTDKIKEIILDGFKLIKTKEDFEKKMDMYATSSSDIRYEAMELLKNSFPQYTKNINIEVLKQIEESKADISDMQGN